MWSSRPRMVWMLDLGTAWASSLPNVRTRSRRQRTWNKAGGVLASRRGPTLATIAARRRVAKEAPVSALSRPPERPSGLKDLAWSRVASEGQDNRNGPTERRGTAGARIWPGQRWPAMRGKRAGRGRLLILARSIH